MTSQNEAHGGQPSTVFGYTFNHSQSDAHLGNGDLLSSLEHNTLSDFFAQTDYNDVNNTLFNLESVPHGGQDIFNFTYADQQPSPPRIHQVSTTLSDQTQFFNLSPRADAHGISTGPDLASPTVFSSIYTNPPTRASLNGDYNPQHATFNQHHQSESSSGLHHSQEWFQAPLVPTPQGPLHEQLAALLPNHSENGTVDAAVAAEFSGPHHLKQMQQLKQLTSPKPNLRRPYAYGTDNSFNSSGFVSSHNESEQSVTKRLLHDLKTLRPTTKEVYEDAESSTSSSPHQQHRRSPGSTSSNGEDDDNDDKDEGSRNDIESYANKRRKSKHTREGATDKARLARRKSSTKPLVSKARKQSYDESPAKKKKTVASRQKPRENLTEEQKRENHIMSEQKRRNLIKEGFEDLCKLVPVLRDNSSMNKSGVLQESVAFLEELVSLNNELQDAIEAKQRAEGAYG